MPTPPGLPGQPVRLCVHWLPGSCPGSTAEPTDRRRRHARSCRARRGNAAGFNIRVQLAASSMPSGIPSSNWQMRTTIGASTSARLKRALVRRACWTKSRTALQDSTSGACGSVGTANPSSRTCHSPRSPSHSRDVTIRLTDGTAASRSASIPASATRCSKPSSNSRRSLSRRYFNSCDQGASTPDKVRSSASAMAEATSSIDVIDVRGMICAPDEGRRVGQ